MTSDLNNADWNNALGTAADKWRRRAIRNVVIKRAKRGYKDGMTRSAKAAEARLLLDIAIKEAQRQHDSSSKR